MNIKILSRRTHVFLKLRTGLFYSMRHRNVTYMKDLSLKRPKPLPMTANIQAHVQPALAFYRPRVD